MKYIPLKYLIPLSIILLITTFLINCNQFKKISNRRELSKSPKPKNNSTSKSSKPKKASKTKSEQTDFSFSNIDGQTGMNSNTGDFGISECYKVLKSTTGDFTESSNLVNLNKINDVIVQAKINGKGEFNFASTYKLLNYFSSPEKTASLFYYKKVSRARTFTYDTALDKLLVPNANTLLQNTITKKDQIFINNCGDSVVDNAVEGGIVIVQVLFNFLDSNAANMFSGSLGKSFIGLNEIPAKIAYSSLWAKISVSITAKQIGGDLKKFMELFPSTKNHCVGNPNDPEVKEEGTLASCTAYISKIDNYLKKDFKLLFTKKSLDSTILEVNKKILKDLKIPPVDQSSLIIKSLKKNITNFTNQNDYYLKKIKQFNEEYTFKDTIDSKFDDESDEFVRKLKQNDFLLKENVDGVFRFSDCFSNVQSCTKVNFDKSYAKLFKDFDAIDKLYSVMKELVNYDLNISDCGLNLQKAIISVRIYPLGNKKYGISYIKSDFKRALGMSDWHWMGGEVTDYNNFSFLVHKTLAIKAIVKPIGWSATKPVLYVNVHCSTMDEKNTGYLVANPNYFPPYVLEK